MSGSLTFYSFICVNRPSRTDRHADMGVQLLSHSAEVPQAVSVCVLAGICKHTAGCYTMTVVTLHPYLADILH